MYKTHSKIKLCLSCCPLYGGCPHLGGSVKGGSTVFLLAYIAFSKGIVASCDVVLMLIEKNLKAMLN